MKNLAFLQILSILTVFSGPAYAQSQTAYGSKIMVVTAHPEATRIGYEILKSGGSAADAAVAVQLALGLVEPQASGIGGGTVALYYDAATKQVHTFDGREVAPMEAGQYLFRGEDGKPMSFEDAAVGGRAVGVPGTLRALELMHKKFGSRPWRDLFSPTIGLAEEGFTVSKRLAAAVAKDEGNLQFFNDALLYFFPDAATPINEGGRLKNYLYASLLRKIALDGPDAFYKGANAELVAKRVHDDHDNPGLLSIEDMAAYEAIERKSVCKTYRGYLICTAGEPTAGGMMVLSSLGVVANFDLASKGPMDAGAWNLIVEAERLALADKNYYMGDPHYVQSPGERLLDADYLKTRAALISPDTASLKVMYGNPPGWEKLKPAAKEPVYPKPPGTSHISIVDSRGNIVSMTSSVQDTFGSRIMVNGYMLNNQLGEFSFIPEIDGKPVANRVEGGKRPLFDAAPLIVFSPDGAPFLVIGSAGGSGIPGYVLQRVIAMIDWKQDLVSALAAPNVINRGREIEMEEGAAYLVDSLKAKGHPVKTLGLVSGINAISFAGGMMTGAADTRREGTAMGE